MNFVHFVNMIDILTFQHDKFVMWCMYTLTKLCKIYNQCHTCNAHASWDSLFVALIRFQCGRYTFAMMHVLPKLTRNYSAPFYCDKHMGRVRQWYSCCRVTMCFTRCFQTMRGRRFLKICHLRIQLWRFLKEWGRGHWYLVINQHVPQRFIQYPNHSSFKKAAS